MTFSDSFEAGNLNAEAPDAVPEPTFWQWLREIPVAQRKYASEEEEIQVLLALLMPMDRPATKGPDGKKPLFPTDDHYQAYLLHKAGFSAARREELLSRPDVQERLKEKTRVTVLWPRYPRMMREAARRATRLETASDSALKIALGALGLVDEGKKAASVTHLSDKALREFAEQLKNRLGSQVNGKLHE